jgi:dTDP-glucose pyrophosphorylase
MLKGILLHGDHGTRLRPLQYGHGSKYITRGAIRHSIQFTYF